MGRLRRARAQGGALAVCGIAGWVAPAASAPEERSLQAMLQALYHRGPDGAGSCSFTAESGAWRVVLGHRRLAIIDPNGSRQPMRDDAAGLALSFNGEIYNFRELRAELETHGHRFERDSDTEVLLRAYQQWGTQCVHRLRGQFAFAVWDALAERLFLARDRFGEKPLYLHEANGALYFASEIKALLTLPQVPHEVDLPAVWDYLAYRYVPGPRTLLSAIRKLPPATAAIWHHGRLQEMRYWTPPDKFPRSTGHPMANRDVPRAFLGKLGEAVEMQMVSDVPFGAYLSGGLDSSVIVALMTRFSPKVKTFSVGFAGDRQTELSHAALVAREFGTEHHEMVVTPRDFIEYLPQLVAARDAPVSEPSDIAIFMLSREARRTVKMVLTGEGSDEILGGYRKHAAECLAWMYWSVPRPLRRMAAPLVQALPSRFRDLKIAMASLNCDDWRERYVRWFGAMDYSQRRSLSRLRVPEGGPRDDLPPFDAHPDAGPLRRMLYFDQTSWLPDNLLERGDRMTMAASIESRVPFLDHELVEFAAALPDHWRVDELRRKRVLREIARSLLPREIPERSKVGFRVPVSEWFTGGMREYLFDHLRSSDSLTRAYYDTAVLDRVVDEHTRGVQTHDKLLWTLLTLEIWHRQYRMPVRQEESLACAA
ncbi:MAG TPA: asparagine synthase (glutamine-hydrolyzing) [Burkholderiales bacterium]|nr:asparagine synthase (glutamine-hydrolyzing) [Burkholderiales bacterium]